MVDSTPNRLERCATARSHCCSPCRCLPAWSVPTISAPKSTYPRPGGSAPPKRAEISNIAWWDQFEDPVLSDLVRTALANNKDLKVATANVDQAAAQYGIVRSAQFPQVNADATAARAALEQDDGPR